MIRARGSERGQSRPVNAAHEAQHLLVILNRCDESSACGYLAAQPGEDFNQDALSFSLGQWPVLRPAESHRAAISLVDIAGGPVDDLQRRLVAGLIVVAP